MKTTSLLSLVGLTSLAAAASSRSLPRDYNAHDYYVLHLDPGTLPEQIALRLGLVHEGQLGELTDHHIFKTHKADHDVVKRELQQRRRRKRALGDFDILDGVQLAQKQVLRAPWEKRVPPRFNGPVRRQGTQEPKEWAVKKQTEFTAKLGIKDPIFTEQWHLYNTVQIGQDVNVTDVWLSGVTGKNATVAIIDDGLDMYSDDLKANYYAKGSWDFNDQTAEPKPRLSDDRHGTRCAGEVSAVRNDVCGIGVAYDSRIAGIRILSKAISDADEALAMNYDFQNNQIYSCSWGPPDDGRSMDAPGILIKRAMLNAVQKGRGGLGSIYVFASGNGAQADDNCNFDGYTNSIYSITIGAVDREGGHPYYSEKCSAGMAVTYSSGAGDQIHTTDVGQNVCTSGHGGTSAAAPLAAGIFALALQVNPQISWRDMQYLVHQTAVPFNFDIGEWQDTKVGKKYSHTFGYGKVDSYALVEAAKTWKSVKPQAWYFSPWMHVKQDIPQGDQGLSVKLTVTAEQLKEANLERLEHVTVTMNVKHTRRGDLSADLISPNGIVSHIAVTRRQDQAGEGYVDWTFMSVVHWGESGVGDWTLIVKDTNVNEHSGSFTDWHLKLWGESIDPAKAKLLPMPTEEDDNDHDVIATTSVVASTTSLPPDPATSSTAAAIVTPSDHPHRPTKPVNQPSGTPADKQGASSTDSASQESNTSSSSWLPSFISNLSTKTQAWIYGALGLIVAFCCGLGIYLWLARRRRLRNNTRQDYEFALLEDEEGEGLHGDGAGGKGGAGAKKGGRKTRGGELYDAFAGGSDDDDFDATGYRDQELGDDSDEEERQNEKRDHREGGDDGDDELHHVIGDDDDSDDEQNDTRLLPRA